MLIPLTLLVGVEALVALLLISRIRPLYKVARAIVDLLCTSKGAAISRTLFVTFAVLLASSISSIQRTKRRIHKSGGTGNPADQYLLRTQILEAAMLGYSLLLAVTVNRFYTYLNEIANLKLQMNVLKKQATGMEMEYKRLQSEQKENLSKKPESLDEPTKSSKDVIADLRRKLEEVQIDAQTKDKEIKVAEANRRALQKQAEGSQLEYHRLLAENEDLRSQLAGLDRALYSTTVKKDA